MIPSTVDIDSIVTSLSDAAVYIDPKFPQADKISEREVQEVIDGARKGASEKDFGDTKVAIIAKSLSPTGMRDVAQRIKDETGANTVVVKSPGGTATVADEFSRYNLESNIHQTYGTSAATGLQNYFHALEQHRSPEALVNTGALIALLLSVAIGTAVTTKLLPLRQASALDSSDPRL